MPHKKSHLDRLKQGSEGRYDESRGQGEGGTLLLKYLQRSVAEEHHAVGRNEHGRPYRPRGGYSGVMEL